MCVTDRRDMTLTVKTLYHTIPIMLLKTLWKKVKMLVTSTFSFFSTMFSSHPVASSIFESHLFCRLQELSIWISKKFSRVVALNWR